MEIDWKFIQDYQVIIAIGIIFAWLNWKFRDWKPGYMQNEKQPEQVEKRAKVNPAKPDGNITIVNHGTINVYSNNILPSSAYEKRNLLDSEKEVNPRKLIGE